MYKITMYTPIYLNVAVNYGDEEAQSCKLDAYSSCNLLRTDRGLHYQLYSAITSKCRGMNRDSSYATMPDVIRSAVVCSRLVYLEEAGMMTIAHDILSDYEIDDQSDEYFALAKWLKSELYKLGLTDSVYPFVTTPIHGRVPTVKEGIIDYNDTQMEVVGQRVCHIGRDTLNYNGFLYEQCIF